MEDFNRHEAADLTNCKRTAQKLYQAIPKDFPKKGDWGKVQQCKRKPGESTFDYFERFENNLNIQEWLLKDLKITKMTHFKIMPF